ncbi:hypothetical protein C1645_879613 [Glomus cerebriforme]|uniref:F-box domain-containing protein n=1 Tax=Glomus cerebriforme TaxID=658196 RepID=A0A397SJ75_9GLOM|nr:hypothetical protein C1645_879613 [Glomus cerebriforme]
MSQLSVDCLKEIFEHLEKKSLHSCILVNRLWCRISIRILWRSVWNFKTLISCLPDESKEILYKNGIFLTSKPPLFNYVTFIISLSIYTIDDIIKNTLKNYQSVTPQSLNYKKYIVTQEIYKLFMNQISLRSLYFRSYKIINIPNVPFISYPGAKDCLKCLTVLSCRSDIYPEFFYQLSQICHNIQSLSITFKKVISNGITDLISVQQNLKYLYIMQSFECISLKDIIPTLTNLPNNLIKLDLYGRRHYIPLSFITKFTNLRELVLSFYNEAFRDFNKLQYVSFPNLKILRFEYEYPEIDILIQFLKINGNNLKELYFKNPDISLNSTITKFCPNINLTNLNKF